MPTTLNQPKSGLLVEVINHTAEFMERILEDVLHHHQPDELKQNLIAGVQQGVRISGEGQLNSWKKRAAEYPAELAAVIVVRKGQIDHCWRRQM